jgi:hypothetical protein
LANSQNPYYSVSWGVREKGVSFIRSGWRVASDPAPKKSANDPGTLQRYLKITPEQRKKAVSVIGF